MVHHVQEVRILVTKTELEALLLEANLISRYQPPYNILLKAGQSFSYLVISHHPLPRVYRQRTLLRRVFFWSFFVYGALELIMTCIYRAFLFALVLGYGFFLKGPAPVSVSHQEVQCPLCGEN